MNKKFIEFMKDYKNKKLAVAVSGGLDSVCLLHWLAELKFDITVLHVNHKLRSNADVESNYVENLSQNLGLKYFGFDWIESKPESGLESAAREYRYRVMTDYVKENNLDALVVAHHANDQIETFLMNLGRGSGIYGLSGMQEVSEKNEVTILRPALKVFRHEFKEYCDEKNIKYFNDEMNENEKYTRVKIRKNRGCLSQMLGISDSRILLAINNLSRTRAGLEKYILEKIKLSVKKDYARFNESFLFDEPVDIRLKLLGMILQKIGGGKYQPRLNSLENALDKLSSDTKITLSGCVLRRLNDEILIVPQGNSCSFRKRTYVK